MKLNKSFVARPFATELVPGTAMKNSQIKYGHHPYK